MAKRAARLLGRATNWLIQTIWLTPSNCIWSFVFKLIYPYINFDSPDGRWGLFAFVFVLFLTPLQYAITYWSGAITDKVGNTIMAPVWLNILVAASALLVFTLAGHFIRRGMNTPSSQEEIASKLDEILGKQEEATRKLTEGLAEMTSAINELVHEIREDRNERNKQV